MTKNQIQRLIKDCQIVKNINFERIKFLKNEVLDRKYKLNYPIINYYTSDSMEISGSYLLPNFKLIKLIENMIVKNEITKANHIYENILVNYSFNWNEPNFIFDGKWFTTRYIQNLPKYKTNYLIKNFVQTDNIKIKFNKNGIWFKVIPVFEQENMKDLIFLRDLILKVIEWRDLIYAAEEKRTKKISTNSKIKK